jgi:hypothetical protein
MRIRFPRNVSHLRTASTLLQRAIAVVLLLGLLLGIAGVPVITVAKKDRSRPFPCQNRPCGCASADECWHHCCCLNNRQKVAWARENGVTPPDFVMAAAEREQAEAVAAGDNDEHGTHDACACCATRAGHSEERACCQQRHNHHDVAEADHARPDHEPQASDLSLTPDNAATVEKTASVNETTVKFVVSDLARRCGGMPTVISLLCDALPFVDRPQWKPVETLVEYLVDVPVACASAELAPPVPPPKLASGIAA